MNTFLFCMKFVMTYVKTSLEYLSPQSKKKKEIYFCDMKGKYLWTWCIVMKDVMINRKF